MKALKLNTYYDNVLIMFLIVITNTTPIYMSQEKRNLASGTFGKVSGTQYTIKTPEQSFDYNTTTMASKYVHLDFLF